MPGTIVVGTVISPIGFYILLAPGVVLGVFVGAKIASLGNQPRTKSETPSNVRTLGKILVALILFGGAVVYFRTLNTFRSVGDEWAFLAIGGIAISFLISSIASAIGTWLFLFVRRRFFGKA